MSDLRFVSFFVLFRDVVECLLGHTKVVMSVGVVVAVLVCVYVGVLLIWCGIWVVGFGVRMLWSRFGF